LAADGCRQKNDCPDWIDLLPIGSMRASEATRLGEIESENAKLKKRLSEAPLHIEALKVGLMTSAVSAWISRWTTAWVASTLCACWTRQRSSEAIRWVPAPTRGRSSPAGPSWLGGGGTRRSTSAQRRGLPDPQNAYIESLILISVALSVTPSADSAPRTSTLRPSFRSAALPPENVTLPA